jgi:phosphatidylserine decarboxylase
VLSDRQCGPEQRKSRLKGRRNPFVAREGIPFLLVALVAAGITWGLAGILWTLLPAALFIWFYLIFRDPRRRIPAMPLGVISPVDGIVTEVGLTDKSVFNGEGHKIVVAVDSLGTYTARCPVEGKIMDLHADSANGGSVKVESSGLWVRTDEDDDVVLQFYGHRFGLAPRAILRYGERVGQGQRCAYLRFTRFAEVQFPINGRALVNVGDRVAAGTGVLAKLPPHK